MNENTAFNFGPVEHGYDVDTTQYQIFNWTPAEDGDYSLSAQTGGDSLLAIREAGSSTLLEADDDVLTGPNASDAHIETVSLAAGVSYEVVLGQFQGNGTPPITDATIIAKKSGAGKH